MEEEIIDKLDLKIITLIIFVLFIGISNFMAGCNHGEKRMQDSAVRYNAGEYYADTEGKVHFRFISIKENKTASNTIEIKENKDGMVK